MNANELFKNKAFDCLEPERKKVFAQLYTELQGKTAEQSVAIIMRFMQTMPSGHKITTAERDAMLTAVTANMTEKEKKNVEMIMKMLF